MNRRPADDETRLALVIYNDFSVLQWTGNDGICIPMMPRCQPGANGNPQGGGTQMGREEKPKPQATKEPDPPIRQATLDSNPDDPGPGRKPTPRPGEKGWRQDPPQAGATKEPVPPTTESETKDPGYIPEPKPEVPWWKTERKPGEPGWGAVPPAKKSKWTPKPGDKKK